MLARIVISSQHIDLPVYHTANSDVLYRGAGHMFGSDLPVGGDGTFRPHWHGERFHV